MGYYYKKHDDECHKHFEFECKCRKNTTINTKTITRKSATINMKTSMRKSTKISTKTTITSNVVVTRKNTTKNKKSTREQTKRRLVYSRLLVCHRLNNWWSNKYTFS